jgi:hypothetical protein
MPRLEPWVDSLTDDWLIVHDVSCFAAGAGDPALFDSVLRVWRVPVGAEYYVVAGQAAFGARRRVHRIGSIW